VRTGAQRLGCREIELAQLGLAADGQAARGGVVPQLYAALQVQLQVGARITQLLGLQFQLHLVDLQFMQQCQGIGRGGR